MPRPLKVYGATVWLDECPKAPNGNKQARCVVAARTKKEVMELFGITRNDFEHSACETGNATEIALAMASPGVVFWKPVDDWNGNYRRK